MWKWVLSYKQKTRLSGVLRRNKNFWLRFYHSLNIYDEKFICRRTNTHLYPHCSYEFVSFEAYLANGFLRNLESKKGKRNEKQIRNFVSFKHIYFLSFFLYPTSTETAKISSELLPHTQLFELLNIWRKRLFQHLFLFVRQTFFMLEDFQFCKISSRLCCVVSKERIFFS